MATDKGFKQGGFFPDLGALAEPDNLHEPIELGDTPPEPSNPDHLDLLWEQHQPEVE